MSKSCNKTCYAGISIPTGEVRVKPRVLSASTLARHAHPFPSRSPREDTSPPRGAVGPGGMGTAAPAVRGEEGRSSRLWGRAARHGQSRSHRGRSRPSQELAQPAPPPQCPGCEGADNDSPLFHVDANT